jgi:cellulose synthase/poly-beta-1,6-N-acetylglucosamine synthase-like glycosyltransferase
MAEILEMPATSAAGAHCSDTEMKARTSLTIGWGSVIFTHVLIIGLPTILYYNLRLLGSDLFCLRVIVATVFLITALVSCYEAAIAFFRRFAGPASEPSGTLDRLGRRLKRALRVRGANLVPSRRPIPRCTFIVAAYLPNEQGIIVETLRKLLGQVRRPDAGLEVILAYNTPGDLPVEDELRRLAERHPELQLLRVENSQSKAENLNAAVKIATGEIVGILDADHHPASDCFERAWRWLESDYDVVQGRNVIRNYGANPLPRMIAVEFECMYGITHPARSLWVGTGIFGGSNGYWRTEVLRRIQFNPSMMTEDIDASARTLLNGYRIVADRSIISTELAPADFKSLWFQRKRWAQGWLEVSFRYQHKFWYSRQLGFPQKLYWTYLLWYRECYAPITLQIFPILLSLLFYQGYIPLAGGWFFWSTAAITLASGPFLTLVAAKNAFRRFSFFETLGYALVVFFYAVVKNMISMVAVYDHLMRRTDWVVTRRQMARIAVASGEQR